MTAHKKIVSLLLIFYIVFPLKIFAAPSYDGLIEYAQPSGKTFEARQWGDEWNNGLITNDGYNIYKNDKTGNWEYYRYMNFVIIDLRISHSLFNSIVGDADPSFLNVPNRHNIVINIDSYASYISFYILVGILCALLIFFIPAGIILLYRWKRYGLTNNRKFFTAMIYLSVFIVLFGGVVYYLFT